MFQVRKGIPGINPQVFPASTWEQGQFFMFFRFSNFGLQNLQKYPSKSLRIYSSYQERTAKQMCQVSLKYMQANGRGNDLKIASFLVFFKMLLFVIQSAFLARHHG